MKTVTQERARYLIRNQNHGCLRYAFGGIRGGGTMIYPDGITEAEDAYIRAAWQKLDGRSCYMSVIYAIAKGANFLVNAEDKIEHLLNLGERVLLEDL